MMIGNGAAVAADQVRTHEGVVEGLGRQPSGVRLFRGVPYAAAPIGPLRWKPPQPIAHWTGVREAKAFGPRCMQGDPYSDMVFRANGTSEDCLYLNVWTPAASAHETLPVLVYFYGGGFMAGDGSEPRYDGESMASKGIVVVTLNYRVGVFGFFAHPDLSKEAPHGASGNQGLLDQLAALQWVKRNIAAFGGDPGRVTIGGESAGSVSVSAQMASPLARGLFHGAIGESGSLLGALSPRSRAEAETVGVAFGQKAGADSLAALRSLPPRTLLDLSTPPNSFEARPNVDGWFLPRAPVEIFTAAQQVKTPLLAGSNTEESSPEWFLGGAPPTVAAYQAKVRTIYGDKADRVLAAYPARADGESVLDAARDLNGDRNIGLSTWRWMDLATRTGGKPTFYYLFAQPRPATKTHPDAPRAKGALHSAEIEYALGNLDLNPVYAWTAEDRATSARMQAYFANFIKHGDPNASDLPPWPTYATGKVLRIWSEPQAETDGAVERRKVLLEASPH